MEHAKLLQIAGILFLLTLISGIILHRKPRPLNVVWFTIHKLTGIGGIGLFAFVVYKYQQVIIPSTLYTIALIVVLISILALVVSGGILGAASETKRPVLILHNIFTAISIVAVIVIINNILPG